MGVVQPKIRLGMQVEQFVFHEIEQVESLSILGKNIQINQNGVTLGELDCILQKSSDIVHLEIVYKFYLYDPEVGTTEIDHWIGPNRKDSLVEKLNKLKNKQLPLLHHPETKVILEKHQIPATIVQQCVHFKAQLFVPTHLKESEFTHVNNNCIYGVYLRFNELSSYSTCKFYIPQKADWLSEPYTQLDWITHAAAIKEIELLHAQKRSPMCWLKRPNGELEKIFVVWW